MRRGILFVPVSQEPIFETVITLSLGSIGAEAEGTRVPFPSLLFLSPLSIPYPSPTSFPVPTRPLLSASIHFYHFDSCKHDW